MEPELNPYAPPIADTTEARKADDAQPLLADRGARFFASLVDALLYLPFGIAAIAHMGLDELMKHDTMATLEIWLFALPFAAYQWYLVTTTGQSLAKKWFGIKIVRMDGSPVNFVSGVLLRNWILQAIIMLPVVGNIYAIVDAFAIFGEKRRCIHDQIAGTKVIVAR